jgi:hypothetical protein
MLNGGAGAFGAALGFGATAGTYLVGTNFTPTRTEATPKDIVGPAPIVGTPNNIQQLPGVGPAPIATA